MPIFNNLQRSYQTVFFKYKSRTRERLHARSMLVACLVNMRLQYKYYLDYAWKKENKNVFLIRTGDWENSYDFWVIKLKKCPIAVVPHLKAGTIL